MNTIRLIPVAVLLSATAFAQTAIAPAYRLNCRFTEPIGKDDDRTCRAELVLKSSFKISCDGRSEHDYGRALSSSNTLGNTNLGLSLLTAFNEATQTNDYPAIYVNADIFKPGFTRAPANLRFDSDSRALHGFCEKGETP